MMNKMSKIQKTMINLVAMALMLLVVTAASAISPAPSGSLTPTAAPTDAGSALFTLEDLYNRLNLGTAGSRRSGAFAEPSSGPAISMHNLNDIMGKAPAVDASGAADGDVLTGKAYWGLTTGQWGPRVGTMPNVGAQNVMPTTASQTITQGYHDGSGKVAGDANLVTGNIKAGTTIFGVTGKTEVVDTTSGNAVAGEIFSGKKAWVDGTEVTGTLETQTMSAASDTVAAGNYAATTLSFVDTDLVAGNIRAGVNLFGVVGNSAVVNTASGNATAGELLYNRTVWVNGQEITGTRVGGVILKAGGSFSPEKRWYDNADGTITDVRTGLVWLKTVSTSVRPCIATESGLLQDMFMYCTRIASNPAALLTDGSTIYDWRVPTIKEMQSLMVGPEAIGGGNMQGFSASVAEVYWTSSQGPDFMAFATINMSSGYPSNTIKFSPAGARYMHLVWPVRTGLLP